MGLFDFTVLGPDGARRTGTIDAPSKELALGKLREEGLTPLIVEPLKEQTNVEDIIARFRPVGIETLVYFSRQMATMVGAAIPPLRALTTMEEQATNPKFKAILTQVIAKVEAGVPLWEALTGHAETFTLLYTAMVRSGEESGNLHGALRELANTLERQLRLKRAIKAATAYPKVVLTFSFFIISGLLLTIVPEFANLFITTIRETQTPVHGHLPSAALPGPTQFVWNISKIMYPGGHRNLFWWGDVALRFAALFALLYGIKRLTAYVLLQPGPRAKWDGFKLRAPLRIGPLVQKIAVARFSRTFASLMKSGVPAQEAMDIVADTAGNVVVSDAVRQARERMLAGATISEPLARSGVFPTMVTRMIEVGEETGQLQEMLAKVAEFFEEEVEAAMKALTSIIEPLMILVVGSSIGFIIIAVYLPMFKLYDLVGTGANGVVISGSYWRTIYLQIKQYCRFTQREPDWSPVSGWSPVSEASPDLSASAPPDPVPAAG